MDSIVFWGIAGLAVTMAGLAAALIWVSDPQRFPRVLIAIAAVMAVQAAAAASGLLKQWQRQPPPVAVLIAITFILTAVLAFSGTGEAIIRKFSLSVLIGFQVFRLPLELLMNRAAHHGIMPVQMSYSGYNFDIVSGALALPVAWIADRGGLGRWVVFVWNLAGSALLASIVAIAVLSIPPIAAFGPYRLNTWVADFPYVWLPGVLVPCALFGHLLVWRAWRRDASGLTAQGSFRKRAVAAGSWCP